MSCPWNKINIPKQTLVDLYENQRLPISQVASKLGYSNGPICRLLKEYKIKVRTVSQAKEKYFISKKELKNLYITQKLSTDQIAEKYGCNHGTIVYKMRKFGIKSRGHLGLTKPINISKENFKYLYHKRNLSASQIAKIVHCSRSGIERKMKIFKIKTRNIDNRVCKYKKYDFSGNLTEKAYMIGFRLGDLNVVPVKNIIVVRCSTTKRNQIKLIRDLFSLYTTPHIIIAKRGTFEITVHLNNTFSFLIPKQDNIESWILDNSEYFWAFFAGYSDAEGCLCIRKNHLKETAIFQISCYDKNILLQLWKGLKEQRIISPPPLISQLKGAPCGNPKYFSNQDMWRLSISQKIGLWKLIHYWEKFSWHKDKLTKIQETKRNIILRNTLSRCHKIDLSKPKLDGFHRPI